MTKSTTSIIALEAESLGLGDSKRITCVFCRGKGQTLSVTKTENGAVLWNCFRASCGKAGVLSSNRQYTRHPTSRKQTVRKFERPLVELSEPQMEDLWNRIGWDAEHVRIARPKWCPEMGRYAFPIFSPMGVRRGYLLRSYKHEPKALTMMDVDEPHLSWYTGKSPGTVWVVEDIPSAVRAAKYVDAVALCGTGAGVGAANEIAAHARNVVWALDEDATRQSLRLCRKWSLLFDSSLVMPLKSDLKDMNEGELSLLLENKKNESNKTNTDRSTRTENEATSS